MYRKVEKEKKKGTHYPAPTLWIQVNRFRAKRLGYSEESKPPKILHLGVTNNIFGGFILWRR